MISTRLSKTILRCLVGGGAVCIAFILPSSAQVQSSKTVTHGEATREVSIERGEIVYVSGNTVVLKMEDGSLREFDDVSDGLNFMVDGKPVNIHNAKVGMKLEKQTITTKTPRVVTTVESVTGRVWHVSPPNRVILTLENGQNQEFRIPRGQRFMVDGRETDAWGLRKGMRVSAQRVTEVPVTVVAQEVRRSGARRHHRPRQGRISRFWWSWPDQFLHNPQRTPLSRHPRNSQRLQAICPSSGSSECSAAFSLLSPGRCA